MVYGPSNRTVDVIIRFHNARKLTDLSYCLFSLYAQTYEHVQPIVVLQNFSEAEISRVRECIEAYAWGRRTKPRIHNVVISRTGDHRSRLLNEGISIGTGRYLAFLDYDDCVYQGAYAHLIGRLRASEAAITFGGIRRADVVPIGGFYYTQRKWNPYEGKSIQDFLVDNCFPIHSFVIDRERVDAKELYFEESLSKNEDYHFLLRIVSQHPHDLGGLSTFVGEHRVRTDGSNTISTLPQLDPFKEAEWEEARRFIDSEKHRLTIRLPIAEVVAMKERKRTDSGSSRVDELRHEVEVLRRRTHLANQACISLLMRMDGEELIEAGKERHLGFVEHWSHEGDVIHFWGWSADHERKLGCAALFVVLDGVIRHVLVPEVPRPDVQKHLGITHDRLGFSAQMPLGEDWGSYRKWHILGITGDGRIGYLSHVEVESQDSTAEDTETKNCKDDEHVAA